MTSLFRILRSSAVLLVLALTATTGFAQNAEQTIREKLSQARPDLQISYVRPSRIPGIYTVQMTSGPKIYIDETGEFFVLGDMYQVQEEGFVNLGEVERQKQRVALVSQVQDKDLISFEAEGAEKTEIFVFTDVDCGYCRKLHREVPELNKMGITVHYLAYPRAGVGSDTYRKMASAWCSDDRNVAMTTLKNGQTIAMNVCQENPVANQFALGQQVGVSGTPTIIMKNGEKVPGYMPAARLAAAAGVAAN